MNKQIEPLLIECVDCKSFPNSCGYWKSKYGKHTCNGFQPAENMNLKEVIYALYQMDIRRTYCNSQVVNVALKYLNELVDFRRNKKIEEEAMLNE